MSTTQSILNNCEDYIISDHVFADAYEHICASKRALIKTALAFHFSIHKKKYEEIKIFENKPDGFYIKKSKKLAPFVICFLDKNFTSPAKLLAVICPALIANIQNIYIFIESEPKFSIITTLELCGLENIYCLDSFENNKNLIKTNVQNLIQECSPDTGRIITFTQADNNFKYFEKLNINSKQIALYNDTYNPIIIADENNFQALSFAYGNCNLNNEQEFTNADISFKPNVLAKQNYNNGMELCYLNEDINLDFFFNFQIDVKMANSL